MRGYGPAIESQKFQSVDTTATVRPHWAFRFCKRALVNKAQQLLAAMDRELQMRALAEKPTFALAKRDHMARTLAALLSKLTTLPPNAAKVAIASPQCTASWDGSSANIKLINRLPSVNPVSRAVP